MKLSDLAKIACGDYKNYSSVSDIFEYLENRISKMESLIIPLLKNNTADQDNITLLGPLYGRKLIETVFIAIIGRLDPLRIIAIKNVQTNPKFDIRKKSSIAIQWSGDVFEKSSDKTPTELWNMDLAIEKIGRQLLGTYYFEIYWSPAFSKIIDYQDVGAHFYEDYGENFVLEKFMHRVRNEASTLFSALSKGVHSEFIIDLGNTLDHSTVLVLLRDTIKLCRTLCLISHAIDTSICKMDTEEAYNLYVNIKRNLER